ncbi:MAG: hypothetical protein E6G32_01700 [Actinobacteria bacterium]|nr:MAG: hypothetical protein E6G32_01700 [Actinomycetota bacterium]
MSFGRARRDSPAAMREWSSHFRRGARHRDSEGAMALKARLLREGGTIGVPAPSSPFEDRSEIDRGRRWWEERGYRVKLGSGVYAQDDYFAGDPETRARDLNALFADPDVDVVQSLRGGYGASQVVPLLDYDTIAENPKPLVGFSDITASAQRPHVDRAPRRDPRPPGGPVHRNARLRPCNCAARRRLPVAAPRDARDSVGVRPGRVHPVLRGRPCTAVAGRRDADAVPERGEARARRRGRDRRAVRVGSDEGPESVAAQPLDGGRLRAPPRAPRRAGGVQPAARARREPLDAPARGHRNRGRRRAHRDDRRAGARAAAGRGRRATGANVT